MKNRAIVIICSLFLSLLLFSACNTNPNKQNSMEDGKDNEMNTTSYEQIDQETAKKMMDEETNLVILDVRTNEEYRAGHIKGAMLLPLDEVEDMAEVELLDKNQTILVYCRSGNRSKVASQILVNLGYKKVYEFGGINTWAYEVEK